MLRELHISGLGVIEDLDLELHPGLNVLSGETGAGKTMITVGLSLALGARSSASLVRTGARAARVQARFEAPPSAGEWAEDGEVILARTISSDGRGSARIGGQLASASTLASVGADLVEVHGQHHAQRLLASVTQTAMLDRFAGVRHLEVLEDFRGSYERLRTAERAFDDLAAASRDRERELDLVAYQVREIEAVDPRPGERIALEAEEARLAHVERLLELAGAAEGSIGGDDGAGDAAGAAASVLADAARLDRGAQDLAARAAGAAVELGELARDLRAYREELTPDPARLSDVRERIRSLATLEKRYGATEEEILVFLAQAAQRLSDLEHADDRRTELEEELAILRTVTSDHAAALTGGRRSSAPELERALDGELAELGMEGASIRIRLVPAEPRDSAGAEHVEVLLSGGPGQEHRPLAKAASGGELSRTMLACRSVLADLDAIPTLVFDEIDAEIGGAAGLAVGRRLARLARRRQILVVTHLPQIACFADRQIRVVKEAGTAAVAPLDDDERVGELARMLAGLPGGEGASSHAEELLAEAGRVKASG